MPKDDELKTLEMYLGMSQSQANGVGWRGTDEGSQMREAGTTHWNSPNMGATNSSGFTALPGGVRYFFDGNFDDFGGHGYLWSATEGSSTGAYYRSLSYISTEVTRYNGNKGYGFSVRCVRD